jgi:hypothetical protein
VSTYQEPGDSTAIIRRAALLVIRARQAAAEMLAVAEIDSEFDPSDLSGACMGSLVPDPGEGPIACGCTAFRSAADPDVCINRWRDFQGPDIGAGAIIRPCGHTRKEHVDF